MITALTSGVLAEELRTLDVNGERIEYRLHSVASQPGQSATTSGPATGRASAIAVARELHAHLAEGNIEAAAVLSTAPKRRFEVLTDYRNAVGDAEFRRVFAQYRNAENRLLAEATIGQHRLLVWELGESKHLAGEYYIEVEGKFLLDDAPNATRSRLRHVLEAFRSGRLARPDASLTPSSRTD